LLDVLWPEIQSLVYGSVVSSYVVFHTADVISVSERYMYLYILNFLDIFAQDRRT